MGDSTPNVTMQHGHRPATSAQAPATLVPETGWHFLHLFYRIDRQRLRGFTDQDRRDARDELTATLLARSPAPWSNCNALQSRGTRPISVC